MTDAAQTENTAAMAAAAASAQEAGIAEAGKSVPAAEPISQPIATDTAITAAVTTAAPASAPEIETGNAASTSSATESASQPSSPATATAEAGGDAPNAASVAADVSPKADGSATNADGAGTSSPIAANSDAELPLHVRVAHHLEAIFQLTKSEVEAPARSLSQEAVELKAHITETLHKLHNGVSVAEGELVQKLEAILRLL